MTVKERIKKYIDYKKISNRAFSLSIGMSENYVTNIRKSIQPHVINSIVVNYPDLNITWLLTGEGEMLKKEADNHIIVGGGSKGVAIQNTGPVSIGADVMVNEPAEDYYSKQTELEILRKEVKNLNEKIVLLENQLAEKERTINLLLNKL